MKFAAIEYASGQTATVITEGGRMLPLDRLGYDFGDVLPITRLDDAELDELKDRALRADEALTIGEGEYRLLAPIVHPAADVICLGLNYKKHAQEASSFESATYHQAEDAIYFGKHADRAAASGESIFLNEALVDSLDYEAELAVVIGRACKNVCAEQAREHIFGYTVINDVSARNVQRSHKQWYLGKSADGYTPMGPCIVTADEFAFPPELPIRSFVNGQPRQCSNTGLMIHGIGEIISELSAFITLRPGMLIATGTPEGVGMGMEPPCFLKKGDEVVCEIEGIGRLVNTIE